MTDPLRAKQTGVARGMGIGLGVTIAAMILWLMRASPDPLADRLATLSAALAILGAWLAVTIGNVARLRFFMASAIDAGGNDDDPAILRARALVQNTLEQVAIAATAYVALALEQESSRPLIVALAALFSVGRMLFVAGYAEGAAARATGFALTFYPSVAGLVVALATLIMH